MFGMPHGGKEPLERASAIPDLPAGIYMILWKMLDVIPTGGGKMKWKMAAVFSWRMEEETIER